MRGDVLLASVCLGKRFNKLIQAVTLHAFIQGAFGSNLTRDAALLFDVFRDFCQSLQANQN
jgi:hypothetical protein